MVLPAKGGEARTTSGPVRWAAPGGLRCLVEDLASGLDVTSEHEVEQVDAGEEGLAVDGAEAAAVVLAMPQPQADRPAARVPRRPAGARTGAGVAAHAHAVGGLAAAVVVGRVRRCLRRGLRRDRPDRRRTDADAGTAHPCSSSTARRSSPARWIDDPDGGTPGLLEELGRLLGGGVPADEPVFARVRRWSLASPCSPQERPFALDDEVAVGVLR